MRYTTPIWVRPIGHYNSDGDFCRTGSRDEVGVPLPNPGRVPPKPGHWRTSPLARPKPKPRTKTSLYMPANVQGVATNFRSKQRLPRAAIRKLIQAGALPPEAMPKRGGK